jgi:hypothetical protein
LNAQIKHPGGAETAIRQYCIILSMLELAKKQGLRVGNHPLIIDAPLSNLNTTYRFGFYKNLLEEDVTEQMIVLSYDLVEGCTENGEEAKINKDGERVLELMNYNEERHGTFTFKKDENSKVEILNR